MENKILNENCLDGILKLKNESVDLIVTDPPYSIGVSSNGARSNFSDNNLIVPFFKELFSQMERVLKHGGELYLFTDWRTYPLLYPLLEQKFKIRNCIVWDYEWIKAGSFYRFRHEFIIYCTKGDTKARFSMSEPDVWRMKPVNFTGIRYHPAQKPIEVLSRIIENSSRENELVLDCFIGSGSTAIACIEKNRKYVGFEIDENIFNTARKRIEDFVEQKERTIDLFQEVNDDYEV
ncbi:DNA-methyltransferase [Streptococcus pluranimalium]|uniref:DNA-methyltransferase n=1 Tax=Streptococcus pluranimalium TaxID=82348 RepID=UPI0039FD3BA1